MNLDLKLTQLGLRIKNFVVLDLSFPSGQFAEFRKAYEERYIYLPCRTEMALSYAAGLASFGKIVLIYGSGLSDCDLPDSTLNVKVLDYNKDAVWDYFEEGVQDFGPAVLLIPEEE
jgi:hypothetical protein